MTLQSTTPCRVSYTFFLYLLFSKSLHFYIYTPQSCTPSFLSTPKLLIFPNAMINTLNFINSQHSTFQLLTNIFFKFFMFLRGKLYMLSVTNGRATYQRIQATEYDSPVLWEALMKHSKERIFSQYT